MPKIQLTREQYDKLKGHERELLELLPQCDDLHACGIDASGIVGVIQQLTADISEIERRFATPAPR